MSNRKANGQFKRGKSGNPKGRPSTNIAALRDQLADNIDEVIHVVLDAALGGDLQACKLLLDRTIPTIKPQQAPVHVKLPKDGDVIVLADSIIRATAKGELPTESAAQLINALARAKGMKTLSDDEMDEPIGKIQIEVIDTEKVRRELSRDASTTEND